MTPKAKELYDRLEHQPGIRKVTADTKTVKELILATDARTLLNGKLWDIKAKSIFSGVNKVWLEEFKK